jgi:hypothetical protein
MSTIENDTIARGVPYAPASIYQGVWCEGLEDMPSTGITLYRITLLWLLVQPEIRVRCQQQAERAIKIITYSTRCNAILYRAKPTVLMTSVIVLRCQVGKDFRDPPLTWTSFIIDINKLLAFLYDWVKCCDDRRYRIAVPGGKRLQRPSTYLNKLYHWHKLLAFLYDWVKCCDEYFYMLADRLGSQSDNVSFKCLECNFKGTAVTARFAPFGNPDCGDSYELSNVGSYCTSTTYSTRKWERKKCLQ